MTRIVNIILRVVGNPAVYPMNPDHVHEFTMHELRVLLSAAGFEECDIYSWGVLRGAIGLTMRCPLGALADELVVISRS